MDNRCAMPAVYEILKDYSDEKHPLNSREIISHLEKSYDIKMNRTTLRSYINALNEFGIETAAPENFLEGKFLVERQFEESEIFLLANLIHSSHYIPAKMSNDLIKKLLNTQTVYFRNDFHHKIFHQYSKKTNNQDVFLNIECLLEAIAKKKVVSFQYYQYDINKKLVMKREKPYKVIPIHVITENNKSYLICTPVNHLDSISHYRIDFMKKVEITEDEITPVQTIQEPYQYIKNKTYMYGGKDEKIMLRFHKKILNDIIDQFGKDIIIQQNYKDEELCDVLITSTRQGIIYFALQFAQYCEILEPIDLRNEIKNILKTVSDKYNL